MESGKFYVGSAVNVSSRWSQHRHHLLMGTHCNRVLQNAWNKYGEDGLSFQVIEVVQNPDELITREQFWLDFLCPEYNICKTAGSRLGTKHTIDALEKMRAASTGRIKTPEEIKKRVETLKSLRGGRPLKKYIKKGTGRPFGIPVSQEARDKISSKLKWNRNGFHTKTAECIERISLAHKGRKFTPEHRAKLSASRIAYHEALKATK